MLYGRLPCMEALLYDCQLARQCEAPWCSFVIPIVLELPQIDSRTTAIRIAAEDPVRSYFTIFDHMCFETKHNKHVKTLLPIQKNKFQSWVSFT